MHHLEALIIPTYWFELSNKIYQTDRNDNSIRIVLIHQPVSIQAQIAPLC